MVIKGEKYKNATLAYLGQRKILLSEFLKLIMGCIILITSDQIYIDKDSSVVPETYQLTFILILFFRLKHTVNFVHAFILGMRDLKMKVVSV